MIGGVGELHWSITYIHLKEPNKSEDKAEQANVATNKISTSLVIIKSDFDDETN